jgi:hypothetical protein
MTLLKNETAGSSELLTHVYQTTCQMTQYSSQSSHEPQISCGLDKTALTGENLENMPKTSENPHGLPTVNLMLSTLYSMKLSDLTLTPNSKLCPNFYTMNTGNKSVLSVKLG